MMDRKEQTIRIKNLYATVITSAIHDFNAGAGSEWYQDAKEFLESDDLDFYADPLAIHQDYIRRALCLTSTNTDES